MTTKYDNSGALFINDRKEKDTHPDHNGSITVEGKEYWLSGWNKQGSKGDFISVSVKPKEAVSNAEQKRTTSMKAQAPTAFAEDLDDEIPF